MVVRLNEDGKVVTEGSQVQLGGNDIYKVVCRKHFRELTNLI
jgi:thymidine kinase